MHKTLGMIGAVWGMAGVIALLVYAIWRLGHLALDSFAYELSALQWLVLIANVLFMLYSEGYKGFQLSFAPRTAARALHLSRNPQGLRILLAPLFVMGFFHTTRRRLVGTYALTIMIVTFIILLQELDQPWRGIVDAGVVAGLIWGVASLCVYLAAAFGREEFRYSPELSPEG